jgi:uncharacterized metal-binding protein
MAPLLPVSTPLISPVIKIVVGLILIFVASKIVGFLVRLVGVCFVGYGGVKYFLTQEIVSKDTVIPLIVGLVLIFVGKGMAETAVRIVGALVVLWGVLGLGII